MPEACLSIYQNSKNSRYCGECGEPFDCLETADFRHFRRCRLEELAGEGGKLLSVCGQFEGLEHFALLNITIKPTI